MKIEYVDDEPPSGLTWLEKFEKWGEGTWPHPWRELERWILVMGVEMDSVLIDSRRDKHKQVDATTWEEEHFKQSTFTLVWFHNSWEGPPMLIEIDTNEESRTLERVPRFTKIVHEDCKITLLKRNKNGNNREVCSFEYHPLYTHSDAPLKFIKQCWKHSPR